MIINILHQIHNVFHSISLKQVTAFFGNAVGVFSYSFTIIWWVDVEEFYIEATPHIQFLLLILTVLWTALKVFFTWKKGNKSQG